ncbi:MAG: hypothetical protein M3Y59_22255 [Myxococcota bacterium]|nr:hypothetical protein [Myxococcota bacterium]
MGKAAGLMAVVFMVGGGVMTVTSAALGHFAEAAALAVVGLGMFGTSQLLSPQPKAHPKATPSEAH